MRRCYRKCCTSASYGELLLQLCVPRRRLLQLGVQVGDLPVLHEAFPFRLIALLGHDSLLDVVELAGGNGQPCLQILQLRARDGLYIFERRGVRVPVDMGVLDTLMDAVPSRLGFVLQLPQLGAEPRAEGVHQRRRLCRIDVAAGEAERLQAVALRHLAEHLEERHGGECAVPREVQLNQGHAVP